MFLAAGVNDLREEEKRKTLEHILVGIRSTTHCQQPAILSQHDDRVEIILRNSKADTDGERERDFQIESKFAGLSWMRILSNPFSFLEEPFLSPRRLQPVDRFMA